MHMKNEKTKVPKFKIGDPVVYQGKTYTFPGVVCAITDDGQYVVRATRSSSLDSDFIGMKHIYGESQLEAARFPVWLSPPLPPAEKSTRMTEKSCPERKSLQDLIEGKEIKNSLSSPSWDEYYMQFAKLAATKSKDSTQVGAILVGPQGEIRLTGFNGPPKGVEDKKDRREGKEKYLFSSHAEANLIAFAAREGIPTRGCHVYVTHFPCSSCARALIQAGISRVIYLAGQTSMPKEEFYSAFLMFKEARVETEVFDECENTLPP